MASSERLLEELWNEVINGGLSRGWLNGLVRNAKELPDGSFADVGPAVQRLLDAGASVEDLCRLVRHERYMACLGVLCKIDDLDVSSEDLAGLDETFLTAEPSGLEGRPGSWPLPRRTGRARKGTGQATKKNPSGPLFHLKQSHSLVFSPDGARLAVVAVVPTIFDTASGQVVTKCEMPSHTGRLAYSPDGRRLAGLSTSGRIGVCDAQTGKSLFEMRDCSKEGSFVAFSPDGSNVVSADWDGNIWVWDARKGRLLKRLECPHTRIRNAAFTADGRSLILSLHDRNQEYAQEILAWWDWPLGKRERSRLELDYWDIRCIAPGPVASMVGLIANSDHIVIFDADAGEVVKDRKFEMGMALCWSPDGKFLAATLDGEALLLDVPSLKERARVSMEFVCDAAFTPDSKILALGSGSKGQVWTVEGLLSAR